MASAPQHGDYEIDAPIEIFRTDQTHPAAAVGHKLVVLAIDKDRQCLALLSAALKPTEIELLTAGDLDHGLEIVERRRPQVVLLDIAIAGLSGLGAMNRILEVDSAINVVLMTARYSSDRAAEALQKGACDYIGKPLSLYRLRERMAKFIGEAQRRDRARHLDRQLSQACRFEGMIGRSPLMLDVFARIARIAPHFRSALVSGAAGTGKELAAKAIHRLSPVASGPFVVWNCSASCDKAGVFEAANGGTLFLDEIGKLPLTTQAKLLRTIQNQEVRVIAGTSCNPRTLVRKKALRADLCSRLSMNDIRLPLLAERKEDVPLLLRYFLDRFSRSFSKRIEGLTRPAEMLLARYSWPENVRELENAIGHGCRMTQSGRIDVRELPASFHGTPQVELVSVDEIQRSHARKVLDHLEGDKLKTAAVLGVSRATLYRLLAQPKAAHAKQ